MPISCSDKSILADNQREKPKIQYHGSLIYAIIGERSVCSIPLHSWRALGQLQAEVAIEPLLTLFERKDAAGGDDWLMNEEAEVYKLIGPVALPALSAYIADDSHNEWGRVFAASSIAKIGENSPAARAASIEILSKQLEVFQEEEYEFNAALVRGLVDLHAKEAAPLIEKAYQANAVEVFVTGDWVDTQEALGLLSPEELAEIRQREEAEEQQFEQEFEKRLQEREAEGLPFPFMNRAASPSEAYWRQSSQPPRAKKARHKDKLSKQARKKNRKR